MFVLFQDLRKTFWPSWSTREWQSNGKLIFVSVFQPGANSSLDIQWCVQNTWRFRMDVGHLPGAFICPDGKYLACFYLCTYDTEINLQWLLRVKYELYRNYTSCFGTYSQISRNICPFPQLIVVFWYKSDYE